MTEKKFLALIRSRVARIAVSASAVRGRGNKGVVPAAQRHLRHLDLAPFGTSDSGRFEKLLDHETEVLRVALPFGARRWGIARKVLNIYIRDCFYTTYLCEKFDLDQAEYLFEIPLDSFTSKGLRHDSGRGVLPPWPGVKGVTPELNAAYQKAAIPLAEKKDIARVHLDAFWWSVSRDE
jgi:hypothetical protein